jgi:hypothetical protein
MLIHLSDEVGACHTRSISSYPHYEMLELAADTAARDNKMFMKSSLT